MAALPAQAAPHARSGTPRALRLGALGLAALLLVPVPGSVVQAHVADPADVIAGLVGNHTFLGDPLWGLDGAGELLSIAPDEDTGVASSGKSWTLHMVFHAIDDGLITNLNETMTAGASAVVRPCQCMTDAQGNRFVLGEQFRFWDGVMGMVVDSANDITTVVAEHIGLKLDPTCNTNWPSANVNYPSTCMTAFLNWSNAHVHSAAVGASPLTNFVTPYISDNVTVRDVAKWFDHAVQEPRFRAALSLTTFSITSLPPLSTAYTQTRGVPNIVGLEAWKDGNTNKCNGDSSGCRVSSASRIGRRLIAAVAQSQETPDSNAMYNYGFDAIFHPGQRLAAGTYNPVQGHRLACVGPSHGVSAFLTASGNPNLLLWGTDHRAAVQLLDQTGHGYVGGGLSGGTLPIPALPPPADGLAAQAKRTLDPLLAGAGAAGAPAVGATNDLLHRAVDTVYEVTRPLATLAQPPLPPVPNLPLGVPDEPSSIEVSAVGDDRVVVAFRHGATTVLSSWAIVGDDLEQLDAQHYIGQTSDVKLAGLDADQFIVLAEDLLGQLHVGSFRLTASGQIQYLAAADETPAGKDAVLEVVPGNGEFGIPALVVAAAIEPLSGNLQLHEWRMVTAGTDFTFVDTLDPLLAGVDMLDLVRLNMMPDVGEDFAPPGLALGYRAGGQLRVAYYTLPYDVDEIVIEGAYASGLAIGATGGLELASLGPHSGLLVALQADEAVDETQLFVLEARRGEGPGINTFTVSDHDFGGAVSLEGLCRVRHGNPVPAEGDYLLADLAYGTHGLEIRPLRSGPRPT
jgi:hypothetical protein